MLDRMAERLATRPDILDRRRETVEHPFGSIKQSMNQGAFLMRGLDSVNAEFSLTPSPIISGEPSTSSASPPSSGPCRPENADPTARVNLTSRFVAADMPILGFGGAYRIERPPISCRPSRSTAVAPATSRFRTI
ncbi:hypothetical protein [Sphingomonas aerolata]|uniref:hypothetical protein n=1 Tax=Sphingomonas aerolata TaxID=185951 RepID=UPI00335078F8